MAGSDIFSMKFSTMDEITCWLTNQIYSQFQSHEVSAWIFGSWVGQTFSANDCDVLIFVDENSITKLANLSLYWKQEFEKKFGIQLHLTRLSFQEAKTVPAFTNAVFAKPTIRL